MLCKICKSHQPSDDLFYMQPDTVYPKTDKFLFIFYELETRQEKFVDKFTVEHEPNLCVFKQCCKKCIKSSVAICNNCGLRVQTLINDVVSCFMINLLDM